MKVLPKFLVLLIFSNLVKAQTLHTIIVYDITDPKFGLVNVANEGYFRPKMKELSEKIGYKYTIKNLYRDSFTQVAIEDYVTKMKVAPNDIIFFYYSGQAQRDYAGRFPHLKLKATTGNKPYSLSDVGKLLKSKKPQLAFCLADCLNDTLKLITERSGTAGIAIDHSTENFKELFLGTKGLVMVSSAQSRTPAYYTEKYLYKKLKRRYELAEKGSAFTNAFAKTISRGYRSTGEAFTMEYFLEKPRENIDKYINNRGFTDNHQQIVYEIEGMKASKNFASFPSKSSTGLLFDAAKYEAIPQKFASSSLDSIKLPQQVDLSPYVPTVINQGAYGTCVSFATTYYMRTILEAIRRNITDKKEIDKLALSPSYIYNKVKAKEDTNCQNGVYPETAFDFLKQNGVLRHLQQGYPYCGKNLALAPEATQILEYNSLFSLTKPENKIPATQKALSENTPVVVGIQTTPHFTEMNFLETLWNKFLKLLGFEHKIGLWEPEREKQLGGGHAVCIVGYDNNWHGGAFKVVNSYGPGWGDQGYFWIKYKDFENYVHTGFQAYVPSDKVFNNGALFASLSLIKTEDRDNSLAVSCNNYDDTGKPLANKPIIASYQLGEALSTADIYKFNVSMQDAAYMYLLEANSSENIAVKLFPFNDNISAYIGAKTKVVLPSPDSTYTLYPPVGKEQFLFLFSEKALNIDSLQTAFNSDRRPFEEKIMPILGKNIIPQSQINYLWKSMAFSVNKSHSGFIVPLLMNMQHEKPREIAKN